MARLSRFCLLGGLIACGLGLHTASLARQLAGGADPILYGGGNVGTNGQVSNETLQYMAVLRAIGANSFRVNLYLSDYVQGIAGNKVNWSDPKPETLDGVLQAAHDSGFDSPYLILEYYSSYYATDGLGSYSQFKEIGRQFAEYARPGGIWAKNHSARSTFGVRHYTWANEPDGTGFDKGGAIGPGPYRAALQGLSDGVKGADPSLKVLGGGYKTPNMGAGHSLKGIGPALAPLWSNGTLDAVDLHTYNGPKYAPINGTYNWAANGDFNGVLNYANVSREQGAGPVTFVATEMNYKAEVTGEHVAARGILTGLVDNAGAVAPPSASGSPEGAPLLPVATVVFPWNLFHTPSQDGNYGMALSLSPYHPTERAAVFASFVQLVGPMALLPGASQPHPGRGTVTWMPVQGGDDAAWNFRPAGDVDATGKGAFGGSLPPWFAGAVGRADEGLQRASGLLRYVRGLKRGQEGGQDEVLQVTAWQNRPHWSNCSGSSFELQLEDATVAGDPATVDVLAYTGQVASIPVSAGSRTVQASGLPEDQTLVFVVKSS